MSERFSQTAQPLWRRWGPWRLSLFLFALVVILANVALVYYASASWTGVVTQNPYEKGLAYNKVLAEQQLQDSLGWQGTLQTGTPRVGAPEPMVFTLTQRDGTPLQGAAVTLQTFRPVAAGHDQHVVLSEIAPGQYTARISFPLPGVWEVKISAIAHQAAFRHAQRIHVGAS
ncbi:MAG: FixH family protein [Magnetococcales bacterium]|nr:FixH family protein [Magnetococcales bacterium]MBF0321356.1 FixH family protein [Magnetococcales bacterium]